MPPTLKSDCLNINLSGYEVAKLRLLPTVRDTRRNTLLLALLGASMLLGGCSQSDSDDSAESTSQAINVIGAGIKGPLAGASVAAYKLNTLNADLKGMQVASGSTDGNTNLHLSIPAEIAGEGPFLIEYTGGTELNGSHPAIDKLVTILSSSQLQSNTPVFATPLSTFAIEYAAAIADNVDEAGTDPSNDDLAGDNDGVIDTDEFLAALDVSQRNVRDALGFGMMDNSIDLFTTSPILDANTNVEDTLAVRTANEAFAAIVSEMTDEIVADGLGTSGTEVVAALADDFSDGSFDSQSDSTPLPLLARLDDIDANIQKDPSQLTIPGTNKPVTEMDDVLEQEADTVAPEMSQVDVAPPTVEPAEPSVYVDEETSDNGGGNTEPANDNRPVVTLLQPSGNQTLDEGEHFGINVNATDVDDDLSHCRLRKNGQLVRQLNSAPWSWGTLSSQSDAMLNNLLAGEYSFRVTCYDVAGRQDSVSVTVTVNAVVEPPTPVPPSVTISSADSSLDAGEDMEISAIANDSDGSIAHCQLRLDGQLVYQKSSAPFTWSGSSHSALANMEAGNYSLNVTCIDNDGLSDSDSHSLTVNTVVVAPDPIPPVVSFSVPANGTIITRGQLPAVVLNTTDSDGEITFCELYIDGQHVRTDHTAPYQFGAGSGHADTALSDMTTGDHTLGTWCYDTNGMSTYAGISVTVEDPEMTLGSVTLHWSAPTARADGSALEIADIHSYEIYYYQDGANFNSPQIVPVDAQTVGGQLITEYTVADIPSGNYWFTILTIDTNGNFSDIVNPIAVNLP